jgi:hypothetical protein
MPKVEEFYHIYNKRWSATQRTRRASACAAGAPALLERRHNFRHFRSFYNFSSFVVVSRLYIIVLVENKHPAVKLLDRLGSGPYL